MKRIAEIIMIFVNCFIATRLGNMIIARFAPNAGFVGSLLAFLVIFLILSAVEKKAFGRDDNGQENETYKQPEQKQFMSFDELSEYELQELRGIAEYGGKVKAIKRLREMTGASLKDSKDFVDRLL